MFSFFKKKKKKIESSRNNNILRTLIRVPGSTGLWHLQPQLPHSSVHIALPSLSMYILVLIIRIVQPPTFLQQKMKFLCSKDGQIIKYTWLTARLTG